MMTVTVSLLRENVNYQQSEKPPLKIAIEVADAKAIERLVESGTEIEGQCHFQPSALCYAKLLLHESLYGDDPTQM